MTIYSDYYPAGATVSKTLRKLRPIPNEQYIWNHIWFETFLQDFLFENITENNSVVHGCVISVSGTNIVACTSGEVVVNGSRVTVGTPSNVNITADGWWVFYIDSLGDLYSIALENTTVQGANAPDNAVLIGFAKRTSINFNVYSFYNKIDLLVSQQLIANPIFIGDAAQVANGLAKYTINTLPTTVLGDTLVFVDGAFNTLTADRVINCHAVMQSPAGSIDLSTFKLTLSGAKAHTDIILDNAGANKLEITGANSSHKIKSDNDACLNITVACYVNHNGREFTGQAAIDSKELVRKNELDAVINSASSFGDTLSELEESLNVHDVDHIQQGLLYPYVLHTFDNGVERTSTTFAALPDNNGIKYQTLSNGIIQNVYCTEILGSKPIKNMAIGAYMGYETFMFDSLQLLDGQWGWNKTDQEFNLPVYAVDGREYIRWATNSGGMLYNAFGNVLNLTVATEVSIFEVIGYFTHAKWILNNTNADRNVAGSPCSLNGVEQTATISGYTAVACPLTGKYYDAQVRVPIPFNGGSANLGINTFSMKQISMTGWGVLTYFGGIELGVITDDPDIPFQTVVSKGAKIFVAKTTLDTLIDTVANKKWMPTYNRTENTYDLYDDGTNSNASSSWGGAQPTKGGRCVIAVNRDINGGLPFAAVNWSPKQAEHIGGMSIAPVNPEDVNFKSNEIGSEKVVNGDMSSTTGWTINTGWSIAGGKATAVNSPYAYSIYKTLTLVAGKDYLIKIVCDSCTDGTFRLFADSLGGPQWSTSGTYYFKFKALDTSVLVGVQAMTASSDGVFDNMTVYELKSVDMETQYELARIFLPREFGNGGQNGADNPIDFSTKDATYEDISYTLDDGRTCLYGNMTVALTVNNHATFANNGYNFKLEGNFQALKAVSNYGVTFSGNWDICSGLPVGDHIYQCSRISSYEQTSSIDGVDIYYSLGSVSIPAPLVTFTEFHLYKLKQPVLPDGSVVLADYMISADPIEVSTVGTLQIGQGTKRVSSSREIWYDTSGSGGTHDWVVSNSYLATGGHSTYTNRSNKKFRLSFFGIEICVRYEANPNRCDLAFFRLSIDGGITFYDVSDANLDLVIFGGTGSGGSATAERYASYDFNIYGRFAQSSSSENGHYVGIKNLPLNDYVLECYATEVSEYMVVDCIDIHNPIQRSNHYQKLTYHPYVSPELVGGGDGIDHDDLIVSPQGFIFSQESRPWADIDESVASWNVAHVDPAFTSGVIPYNIIRGDYADNEPYKVKNCVYVPFTGEIITQESGEYDVYFRGMESTGAGAFYIKFLVNGVGKAWSYSAKEATANYEASRTVLGIYLKKGDKLTISWHGANIYSSGARYTMWLGRLVNKK